MKLTINGQDFGGLKIKPTDTIAYIKKYTAGYNVVMTFSNGETLDQEVWQTDKYDNVTFEHYADVINGGTLDLVTKINDETKPKINDELEDILADLDAIDNGLILHNATNEDINGTWENLSEQITEFLDLPEYPYEFRQIRIAPDGKGYTEGLYTKNGEIIARVIRNDPVDIIRFLDIMSRYLVVDLKSRLIFRWIKHLVEAKIIYNQLKNIELEDVLADLDTV